MHGALSEDKQYIKQGGLRRGGLTPALDPRMPVLTKDVL